MTPRLDDSCPHGITRFRMVALACAGYEQAWRAGSEPRIEDYLAQVPDRDRAAWVADLVELDLELRGVARPPASEYLARFPGHGPAIERAFANASRGAGARSEFDGGWDDAPGGDPTPGGRIGNYDLLSRLGEGGMGIVYLARQRGAGREVALKIIRSDLAESAGGDPAVPVVERFRREVRVTARLRHPNIVTVYEVGEDGGRPYYSMEYIEGRSLAAALRRGPMGSREAAALVEQVARAVHEAHAHDVLHRDIKPGNILLGLDGRPRVADFGLAKWLNEASASLTGRPIGTPSYMSPEQAVGASDLGPAADIYALGATLYEALTARPPFRAATVVETLRQVIDEAPAPPRAINRAVGRDLETICLKCLQKDPDRRYKTARDLADDLRRSLDGEPILARPVGPAGRLWLWSRRNPRVAALSGAVLALGLALVIGAAAFALSRLAHLEEVEAMLARQFITNGSHHEGRGHVAAALPWYVEALGRGSPDAATERVHRLRLASLLRGSPKPAHLWLESGPVRLAAISPDGLRVATLGGSTAQVRDLRTGRSVTMPLVHSPPPRAGPAPPGRPALAFAAGGRLLLSSDGREARVWDAATGEPAGPPLGGDGGVAAAAISPDGLRVATGSGAEVALWDVASGREIGPRLAHPDDVNLVAFRPDGRSVLVAFGGSSRGDVGGAWLWLPDAPAAPALQFDSNDDVNHAAFSRDGLRVVTAGYDRKAQIWDAVTGARIGPAMLHRAAVSLAEFSRDGRWVVTVAKDEARIWDAATGAGHLPPFRHRAAILDAVFSADGRRLVTCGVDQDARVWDASTGDPVGPPLPHNGPVRRAAIGPDGRFVVTAGDDRMARAWDLASAGASGRRLRHSDYVRHAALDPSGLRVATAAHDGVVRLWDAATGRASAPAIRLDGEASHVAFAPDGRSLITACKDGTVRAWDARTGLPVGEPSRLPGAVAMVAIAPDGRTALAVCGAEVHLLAVPGGRPQRPPLRHPKPVRHAAYSRDGLRVVTSCDDGAARLWDVADRSAPPRLLRHDDAVARAEFSPDGHLVATASLDRTARVWDVATGSPRAATLVHAGAVYSVEFSPDGTRVVTGSVDRTARVWDVATGSLAIPPLQHDHPVHRARFSPDGRLVATGSGSRTAGDVGSARVWDAATGDFVTLRLPHGDGVFHLEFRADGRALLTVSGRDTAATLWPLEPDPRSADEIARVASLLCGTRVDGATGGLVPRAPEDLVRDHRRVAGEGAGGLAPSADDLAAWHDAEARSCEAARDWPAAIAHLDAMIALDPADDRAPSRRGQARAERGDLEGAEADFARAVAAGSEERMDWYCCGLLRLRRGDLPGYRALCEGLLDRMEHARDPWKANVLAYLCTLGPGAAADPGRFVAVARRLVAQKRGSNPYANTLGAALYRAGAYEEAVAELERAVRLKQGEGTTADWVYLAMASARLGRSADASRWFARVEAHVPAPSDHPSWHDPIHARLLRDEAARVVGEAAR